MALSTHIKKAQILGESGRGAGGCLIKEERLGVRGGACAARRPGPRRLHLSAVVPGWRSAGRSGRPSINIYFRAYLKGAWWLLKQKEKAVGRGWEGEGAPLLSPSPSLLLPLPPSPSLSLFCTPEINTIPLINYT